VNLLTAENLSIAKTRHLPARSIMDPSEARDMIRHFIRSDMPEPLIIDELARRGVPVSWIRGEIREHLRGARRERGRKRRRVKR
jgi:hypothetical protein